MRKIYLSLILILAASTIKAQVYRNVLSTNPVAEQVMQGNYNPQQYRPAVVMNNKSQIIPGLEAISVDSLKADIIKLGTFHNRNTGSDTVSNTTGIGAARRWVYSKFQQYSAANENRLIVSYLQFDSLICTSGQHRNIFAVLPGIDTTNKSVVLVEGHIDSRCEGLCDLTCLAQGMEDNATGTALVMELARVMSKYAYTNTIIFAVVIGEEQGLMGAGAFAQYAKDKGIQIKAVQNNDVIGGIACGKTASPPTTCVNEGDIDSTHVRIFSAVGTFGTSSQCKAYARFAKLQYLEEVMPTAKVPMAISIMSPEDRTGRGGDHIPFRQQGFRAVRFTASHEHGDANSTAPGYTDRQHSFRDTLGVDTNNDGRIDSFYISFSYLQRNAVINGAALAMAAIGPRMPAFTATTDSTGIKLTVTAEKQYRNYRVSVRRKASNPDLDLLYAFNDTLVYSIPNVKKDTTYYISIASIDTNNVESIFTNDVMVKSKGNSIVTSVNNLQHVFDGIKMQVVPNPFTEDATIAINTADLISYKTAFILITDALGRKVDKLPVTLNVGRNEVAYHHNAYATGTYNCSLFIDGQLVQTQQMVSVK